MSEAIKDRDLQAERENFALSMAWGKNKAAHPMVIARRHVPVEISIKRWAEFNAKD